MTITNGQGDALAEALAFLRATDEPQIVPSLSEDEPVPLKTALLYIALREKESTVQLITGLNNVVNGLLVSLSEATGRSVEEIRDQEFERLLQLRLSAE